MLSAVALCFVFVGMNLCAGEEALGPKLPGYVSSAACGGCHALQTERWQNSHHAWAMRAATPENVLGDFDDAVLEHHGTTSRFRRRGDSYFVETDGPDGSILEFQVTYTVGVERLQQYLVALDGGHIQALSLAWNIHDKRWFHLYPDRRIAPDDGLHWTGVYQNWNSRCAACHSTNFAKNFDPSSQTYASNWTEANVGCEACHGPGEAHVAWATAPETYKASAFVTVRAKGLTVDPKTRNARDEIEICAACHARRQSLVSSSRTAGYAFLDEFVPALLREGLYHADGQILDEVYVYGSFLQTKMAAAGVQCTDCHDAHRLETRARDNAVCTQCHTPSGDSRFPSLIGARYDTPAHHFHRPGSEGALCVNCHMPARTYMVVDPRRDHGFRVPRPDLSVTLGTPNACTSCHTDRDDGWAAAQVKTWYPEGRTGSPHYAEALAAGRINAAGAIKRLAELSYDTSAPGIVRATALDLLRRAGPIAAEQGLSLLTDPDPLVRHAAVALHEHQPAARRLESVRPLLDDSLRAIRIQAAHILADTPLELAPESTRAKLGKARAEYQDSLVASVDFPETQMNLAALAYRLGRPEAAAASFMKALELDPYLGDAWQSLAELQSSLGRNAEAEQTLRRGLEKLPESGPLSYALGLLQAERRDFTEAAASLKRAAHAMQNDGRVRYNLGLVLQYLGQDDAADAMLREALDRAPADFDIVHAVALRDLDFGQFDAAREGAWRLIAISPNRPEGWRLLDEIDRRRMRK